MTPEQKISGEILKRSIALLTPIANDVNGINAVAQVHVIKDVALALMWIAPFFNKNKSDLEATLNRLKEWEVEYKK